MKYDFIVIGSGAAGATAAKTLVETGASVLILEEGPWFRRQDFKSDVHTTIRHSFRDFGGQVAKGKSLIPVLQGSCVGGSTVINGAISHSLPEVVFDEWRDHWNSLGHPSPFELADFQKVESEISHELKMAPTLLDLESLPVAQTLKRLGWNYYAMVRNAPGCKGSGNCLQGCQTGAKLSMEASFVPEAIAKGATLLANHKVLRIQTGTVLAKDRLSGEKKIFKAKRGILVAAGVVHTPRLLQQSGHRHPHIGKNFQTHLSFGVLGKFSRPVRELEGQPQGIEIFPSGEERLKLATQLLPPELLFARTPISGSGNVEALKNHQYFSSWTASIRSTATGSIDKAIHFSPSESDMKLAARGVTLITKLLFEMGAEAVFPGIYGLPERLTSPDELGEIPLDPKAYFLGAGHLFGTCRLGTNPSQDPVDQAFALRDASGIYVVDASVFPTNIGVNPQLPIMAMARLASHRILEKS